MNQLFYVTVYNHRKNQNARFLLTAENSMAAGKAVVDYLGSSWKSAGIEAICETPEEVWKEV